MEFNHNGPEDGSQSSEDEEEEEGVFKQEDNPAKPKLTAKVSTDHFQSFFEYTLVLSYIVAFDVT